MNWIIEHAIGLIIIGLLMVDIYLKRVLYVKLDKIFTEKVEKPVKEDLKLQRKIDFYLKWRLYKVFTERVEKPVKEDLKLQRRAETKADEALKVKNIEEIFIDHE